MNLEKLEKELDKDIKDVRSGKLGTKRANSIVKLISLQLRAQVIQLKYAHSKKGEK